MERYYLGVDWADGFHQIWVSNPDGEKVHEQKLVESVEEFSQFGRRLDEDRAQGIEIWAAIEKPHGRIVEFLFGPRGSGLSGQSQGAGSSQGPFSHESIQKR